MITKNQVLRLDDGSLVRVLWVDHSYSKAYLINIETLDIPYLVNSKELFSMSEEESDSYGLILNEEDIQPNEMHVLTGNWKLIKDIVFLEPEIYVKASRGKMIAEIERTSGKSRKYIYKALKRYWQRGMTKYALLPDYLKCGSSTGSEKSAKVGRKKQFAEEVGNGISITPDILKIFSKNFKRYNNTGDKTSLKAVYEKMITEDFKAEVNSSGKRLDIPSYTQFWYRYNKIYSLEDRLIAKHGVKKFNKDYRATTGNSGGETRGSGDKYQIDATVADIYLVSSMNREWVIGRPILYFCIDVFSRVVAGFHIGLTGPSLEGARLAIMNCAEDKVEFCESYGIDIRPEDWPSKGLPKCFLGDNGEMRGVTPENTIRAFNIEVETTGSYRPDMKGIVEQKFHTINKHVKPVAPGFVLPDYNERGGRDYRKDAVLTLDEFTHIIIQLILFHHESIINNYPYNEEIARAGIDLTPKELWKWGVKNGSGALRSVPIRQLKASLLPHKMASVTPRGIKLHNDVFYELPIAREQGWFIRNGGKSPKVKMSYNPRNLKEAYVFYKNDYIPVNLTSSSNIAKYNQEEIEFYTEYIKKKKSESVKKRFQKLAKANDAIKSVIDGAKTDAILNYDMSDVNIKDIRKQRRADVIKMNSSVTHTPDSAKAALKPSIVDDDFLSMLEEIRNEGDGDE